MTPIVFANMAACVQEPKCVLPYCSPLPADGRRRKLARRARIAAYLLAAVALVLPVVMFQASLHKQLRRAEEFDRRAAAGLNKPGETRPQARKGAVARWRKAVYQFWDGRNIYLPPPERPVRIPPPPGVKPGLDPELEVQASMHPNMPFTVMLLSPLAYMPMSAHLLTFNIIKVAVIVLSCLMAASVVSHDGRRLPDWVLGLGLLWSLQFIVGDIRHGNTNCFVLGGVVFHLWLYRRGRDYLAGIPLAAAICLKLTPLLFIAYWLYQRNWKLAVGTVAWTVVMVAIIPMIALGPERYVEYTGSWLHNIIAPATVGRAWFPVHVNQSLNGITSRYFLTGHNGNMMWDPDAFPSYVGTQEGWITLVALPEGALRVMVTAAQVLILAVMA